MKYSVLILVLLLGGCGWFERGVAYTTGYSMICVNGVQYIQFSSGATVAYNKDGTVRQCN